MKGPALVASALVASARNEADSALADLEEWDIVTRERPYFRSMNLTEAVRIACAAGAIPLGERLLEGIVTAAERDRLSDLTARATIAAARGEDAIAQFAEAAAGWEAFGCRLEHALALRGAGEEAAAAAILAELGVPPATPIAASSASG